MAWIRRKWSLKDEQKLAVLYQDKSLSLAEVALMLNTTEAGLKARVHKLGLRGRYAPRPRRYKPRLPGERYKSGNLKSNAVERVTRKIVATWFTETGPRRVLTFCYSDADVAQAHKESAGAHHVHLETLVCGAWCPSLAVAA